MAYVVGNKTVARESRQDGTVAGRENMTPGVAYPVPFREACYLGAEKSVTSITVTSEVATVACTTHGLVLGQLFRIYGATPAGYNGDHVVKSVTNANEFKYDVPAIEDNATGTLTMRAVHQEDIGD